MSGAVWLLGVLSRPTSSTRPTPGPSRAAWPEEESMSNTKNVPTPDQVNHGDQLNPDHDAYWQSRGLPGRPADPPPPAPAPAREAPPSKGSR